MTDEVTERVAHELAYVLAEHSAAKWKSDWLKYLSYECAKAALATLKPGDYVRPGLYVSHFKNDADLQNIVTEASEEMRERCARRALTIWKDGTWIAWSETDAHYAENEEHWLCTIPGAQVMAEKEDD